MLSVCARSLPSRQDLPEDPGRIRAGIFQPKPRGQRGERRQADLRDWSATGAGRGAPTSWAATANMAAVVAARMVETSASARFVVP